MAIHRDVGDRQQALHHRQADGQVWHEVTVHHVYMQPVGAVDRGRFVRESGEISG
ncbi:Uncharacterised protein [Mycobacterium tuberculosis]|nr:Uncharacterised protein [Mycobacterium tuberculosis]